MCGCRSGTGEHAMEEMMEEMQGKLRWVQHRMLLDMPQTEQQHVLQPLHQTVAAAAPLYLHTRQRLKRCTLRWSTDR
jgi:hypothetical protein